MSGEPMRPTWVEIDLKAIAANVVTIKKTLAPGTRFMAVVKANAYGHGLVPVARAALGAGAFCLGVALPEEGLALRQEGIKAPILVLGPATPEQAPLVARGNLSQTVFSAPLLEALAREGLARKTPIPVHVKVDTGMGRLGVTPLEAVSFLQRVAGTEGLLLEGTFTHLAKADESDPGPTLAQLAIFQGIRKATEAIGLSIPLWHAANSAATLAFPESHLDLVRVGIALYGLAPFAPGTVGDNGTAARKLRPALAWKTRIAFIKKVPAARPLSYGGTYLTSRPSSIATLPVGYADGYPRNLSNRGQVIVGGQRVPVVGRVCMDQILIDVTGVSAREGDQVVLLGQMMENGISAEEFADWLDTINYEVVSRISDRVPRSYDKDQWLR